MKKADCGEWLLVAVEFDEAMTAQIILATCICTTLQISLGPTFLLLCLEALLLETATELHRWEANSSYLEGLT